MVTVGQYTGITDKNGKKIFEGDIIYYTNGINYEVSWHNTILNYWVRGIGDDDYDDLSNLYESENHIVGNIHDNPELLENGK